MSDRERQTYEIFLPRVQSTLWATLVLE